MNSEPRTSIIMPAFNPGAKIRHAIESVIQQSEQDWQLWVVDDGSQEDLSWVGGYDDRIRYIRKTNGGPAAARNTGIESSRSEYIAFLDSDDLWMPEKLKSQLDLLDAEQDTGLVHCQFEMIDGDDNHLSEGFGRKIIDYPDC